MKNSFQLLIEEIDNKIASTKKAIADSDLELEKFKTELEVEEKAMNMEDLDPLLAEDFKYSAEGIKHVLLEEENLNYELKKGLKMLEYRKRVIESQFEI